MSLSLPKLAPKAPMGPPPLPALHQGELCRRHDSRPASQRGWQVMYRPTVDSKKLEYGPGKIYDAVPSSLGFGVGGQSYSNLLASTVILSIK